jgi:actin-related protein
MDELPTVVIDSGSSTCKAGFGGEDAPRVVFPSIVGHFKHAQAPELYFDNYNGRYVGAEAQEKRNILSLKYPIDRGIVTNWDDLETVR